MRETDDLLRACRLSKEFMEQTVEFLCEQFSQYEMDDDSPDKLLEASDDAGYGSSTGELFRIVGQLKRTIQIIESAIAKAEGR